LFLQEQIKDHHHPAVAFPGGFRVNLTGNQKDKVIWRRGPGWRIHGSVEDTKLSTNKQHTLSLSTPNPGKFGAVAEGDLYQPETRPEPVKKGGVLGSKYSEFADMEKFHTGAGRNDVSPQRVCCTIL
jgi:hypothetical protein